MEGTLPETWFAVSPARIRFRRELIGDRVPDHPVTVATLDLLPTWVRWLADRADLLAPQRELLRAAHGLALPDPVGIPG